MPAAPPEPIEGGFPAPPAPEFIGDLVYEMSKSILIDILMVDQNGNIIRTNNLEIIKNSYSNILNKY